MWNLRVLDRGPWIALLTSLQRHLDQGVNPDSRQLRPDRRQGLLVRAIPAERHRERHLLIRGQSSGRPRPPAQKLKPKVTETGSATAGLYLGPELETVWCQRRVSG